LADPEDYYVEYSLSSDWGSGFNSSIMISNVSDKDIEDWILEFDFERDITNIWNGTIPSCEEGHYVIKNSDYNSIIYANHNIQFGFSGCNGSADIVPTDYKLYYYDLSREKADNKEEKNSESNASQDENNSNPVENEKEEKHSDDAKPIDNGQTSDLDKEEQNNPVEEIDKTKDTDKDGLFDYIELQIGTDVEKTDTDGDGLSDYFEIMSMSYDPTRIDTDNNGINDGEEDLDDDGLSNIKELEINTDPSYPDSDEDGLKDGEEINTYNTDPCKYDTDGDYVSDGKEIELGTDPLIYNEKFEVTVTADDVDTVKASVKISLNGKQINTLSVNRFNNDFLFPEDMPGYIGGAYDFKVEGEFDQAILSFEFDEALLDEENFDPVIFYFNEEWQSLEELETKVEGNVATADTTHFSKYILLNRNFYKPSIFDWVDKLTDSTNLNREIVFCIDDSGFIKNADPENRRLGIVEKITDDSDARTKIGILKYDSNEIMLSDGLVHCDESGKETLRGCLKFDDSNMSKEEEKRVFNSRGGAFLYCGIDEALKYFSEEKDDQTARTLIILTSGDAADWISHNGMVNTLGRSGITTYVVRFLENEGSAGGFEGNDMKSLAECTGGKSFELKKDDSLDEIYEELFKGIEIALDSDNDGIPDAYEDGFVLFNGCSIKLNKNNPDTDGDGLLDGEEIVLAMNYMMTDNGSLITVIGKAFSDPRKVDSDGDGESDATDPDPLSFQLNKELCENIIKLDELASEFQEQNEVNVSSIHLNVTPDVWLTFMYIRYFDSNYTSEDWDMVGGAIDHQFIDYVNNKEPQLYEYFKSNEKYNANNIGEKGDVYHLAATLTGLMYVSGFGGGLKCGLMSEKNIDALCGWAGDFQTAMIDARFILGENADYESFKTVMKDLIGCDESIYEKYPKLNERKYHFPIYDVYSDVDAANIYELLREGNADGETLCQVLVRYYEYDYKNRFTRFKSNSYDIIDAKQFTEVHYLDKLYSSIKETDPIFLPGNILLGECLVVVKIAGKKDEIKIVWPLFKIDDDDWYDFNSEESLAAYISYRDYLLERVKNE
ncbi:MAG: cellulose binding domain-containing protein, partial [Eubacterium sp.]|nr:cellulose binding domain-containing protein [Eubacterium sp.]